MGYVCEAYRVCARDAGVASVTRPLSLVTGTHKFEEEGMLLCSGLVWLAGPVVWLWEVVWWAVFCGCETPGGAGG